MPSRSQYSQSPGNTRSHAGCTVPRLHTRVPGRRRSRPGTHAVMRHGRVTGLRRFPNRLILMSAAYLARLMHTSAEVAEEFLNRSCKDISLPSEGASHFLRPDRSTLPECRSRSVLWRRTY
jgi:hypothetical protein